MTQLTLGSTLARRPSASTIVVADDKTEPLLVLRGSIMLLDTLLVLFGIGAPELALMLLLVAAEVVLQRIWASACEVGPTPLAVGGFFLEDGKECVSAERAQETSWPETQKS